MPNLPMTMNLLPMERLHRLGGVVEPPATLSETKTNTVEVIQPSKKKKVRTVKLYLFHLREDSANESCR